MITINNKQQSVAVDVNQLKIDAQVLLHELDYADYDLGILLTDNDGIREYNQQYRGFDKPTDILSFPFYPDLKAGERIQPQSAEKKNLGDIIMSIERIQHDAQELGISFYKRMQELLVHGICHLLGYDHISDADYEIMRKKEEYLLSNLQRK